MDAGDEIKTTFQNNIYYTQRKIKKIKKETLGASCISKTKNNGHDS